jgi:cytochrome c oxidase subunit IV
MEHQHTTETAHHDEHHGTGYQTNILVWVDLLILTLITVRIAFFDLQNLTVIVALGVASVKTYLVGTYFMHLKFESWIFKLMVLLVAIIFVAVLIILFSDYLFRQEV